MVFLLDDFRSTQNVSGCEYLNEGKLPNGKDLSKTFSKPASYKKKSHTFEICPVCRRISRHEVDMRFETFVVFFIDENTRFSLPAACSGCDLTFE